MNETVFISRASEGAISADWIMDQPIFIRKNLVDRLTEELKEREKKMQAYQNR